MFVARFSKLIPLALAAVFLGGCNSGLKEERDRLYDENIALRDRADELAAALQAAEQERADTLNENAQLRMDLEAARAEASRPAQPTTGFEGIPGVSGEMGVGEVTAVVEGDVLFDSGQVTLKSSAKQALDRVAQVLKTQYAGHTIRVEGHTDSDPIRKSQWKTNDRLSAERAMAVKQYLESQGIPGERMYIAGFGPSRPKDTKARSRRVEIVVLLNE